MPTPMIETPLMRRLLRSDRDRREGERDDLAVDGARPPRAVPRNGTSTSSICWPIVSRSGSDSVSRPSTRIPSGSST